MDPVRRSRPDAVVLHVRPGHHRHRRRSATTTPTGATSEYDALYEQQKVELDRDERIDIVHEMLRLFYDESTYVVLFEDADLQAYRTDRFEGWLRQPAEIGPVLFTNTSPTYFNLTPIEGGGGDGRRAQHGRADRASSPPASS